jgi:glycerol uptake facilitator-like aquaporin
MSNLARYGVEFLGTFTFLSVILSTGEPVAIAIALLAAIYFGAQVSGAHFNPAVTFMMYVNGTIDRKDALMYVLVQLAGAYAAYMFVRKVVKKSS